ncbi:OmpH family outer membrane protein [Pedobacter sandarakinus]|uniref:OmpH family outer membrane protein n=1 Tax=Pedobacter sandarakinus TaxID=353156 RepID=UPI00224749C6|nr:OmpH family outer membrane protein [Pedobacter sandarakinus]MCX2576141.1 OmpH family outer membrane protein [Pedobacter sandarakinus]
MTKYLFIILFSTLSIAQTKAQLAVVNSQKVIASMKEFAKIDTLVNREAASYTAEYSKKQGQLGKLVLYADSLQRLDPKSSTTTKAIADAQTADKDLKAYVEVANKKIADYKQLLTKPYTEKVVSVIKGVALRGKFMQVVDSATTNLLYLNPATDITALVIKELTGK